MQLCNVTLHQKRLGLTFQIENPLICRRIWKVVLWNVCKNKISQDLSNTVTVNKHTIINQESYSFGKIFIFGNV